MTEQEYVTLKVRYKAEAESISNQRGLIENFIRSHSEFSCWEICEFCDDGWSGKSFDRPDTSFKTLIYDLYSHEGVPTPMLHKRAAGCSRDRRPSVHVKNFRTTAMICKILRDERYLEKCVYEKRERDMVGNVHTLKHKKEDRIIVDDTHDGIVSKEFFKKAASRMKEYREFELPVSDRNPLRKKAICGTCGYAMSLSNTKNAKYHCRTSHPETQFDCTSEGILQAEKKQARRELAVLQSQKNQFEKSLQDLYEKLIDGSIDKETHLSQKASNQRQMQELTEQMTRLEQTSQTTTDQGGAFIEKYREYTEPENLLTCLETVNAAS